MALAFDQVHVGMRVRLDDPLTLASPKIPDDVKVATRCPGTVVSFNPFAALVRADDGTIRLFHYSDMVPA